MRLRRYKIAAVALMLGGMLVTARPLVAGPESPWSPPSPEAEPVATSQVIGTVGPQLAGAASVLLGQASLGDSEVVSVTADGDALTVCLEVPLGDLEDQDWLGVETLQSTVARALTPVNPRVLFVQRFDPDAGRCIALSDYTPRAPSAITESTPVPDGPLTTEAATTAQPEADAALSVTALGSLAGKTVYLSAGHGWNWTGSSWKTQRIVYQDFIEDHNNAEVVTQYLIPYLENAGATVVPVRERDWNASRAIADNDQGAPSYTTTGTWSAGLYTGYGGSYQYAATTSGGAPTATATWTLSVPAAGRYAVYAWVYPGSNRAADAHYTVHHAGGASEVVLDQQIYPQTWRYLGTFPFSGGTATITLDNRATTGSVVIADAIRLGGGQFDSLSGLPWLVPTSDTPAPGVPPYEPWWETATFYWSQWMGLDPGSSAWPYYNDVVSRPMYARWVQRATSKGGVRADAVYISWHSNGYNGTARGTVSYVHNNETYPRTPGSTELQAAVHNELIHDIRAGWDAAWTDRGKQQANLGELRMLWDPTYEDARIPGVLLELAFHDNYDDALALKEPAFNQLAARAVYQGIVQYFETRDGVALTLAPEPPTHLRVTHAAAGTLRVAWQASPTDSIGLRGDPATGYRVYTSPDGFAWSAPIAVTGTQIDLPGLTTGQTVYVRVTATNAGGESFPTEVLGARVGEARLLLVDGFDKLNRYALISEYDAKMDAHNLRMWLDQMNSYDYVVHHGQAVPADYAWDSASNEAVVAGKVALGAYDVVDWLLGEESSIEDYSFNATERALVTAYVGAGKGFMVSGSEFGWDLVSLGTDPAFLRTTLHTDYVADDAATYTVRPTAGGAFQGLNDLHFDAPGEYDVDYPDVFAPLTGAQSALTYVGGLGGTAATQYASGCERLLVLGFPFETLRPSERGPVMAAALAYLDACRSVDTIISSPTAGSTYSANPAISGTAVGTGLTAVNVMVQRSADGLYWNGSGWAAAAVWLNATGVQTWSYAGLPALADGTYFVRARAVAGEPDPTPAEVTFGIDSVPPPMPTAKTPAEGTLLTTPLPVFWWTIAPDEGSPLTYELAVDATVYLRTSTPTTAPVRKGTHSWRVRAVDAAGNAGPWTDWITFEVDAKESLLPLIPRGN